MKNCSWHEVITVWRELFAEAGVFSSKQAVQQLLVWTVKFIFIYIVPYHNICKHMSRVQNVGAWIIPSFLPLPFLSSKGLIAQQKELLIHSVGIFQKTNKKTGKVFSCCRDLYPDHTPSNLWLLDYQLLRWNNLRDTLRFRGKVWEMTTFSSS